MDRGFACGKYRPVYVDEHLRDAFEGRSFLVQDGAMGTMLQRAGLAGKCRVADLLCIEDPAAITAIHAEYVAAGAELVLTNTFNSNARKLEGAASVAEVYAAAVKCARDAKARYVAADMGPTGALLEPLGDMPFDEAYGLFAEQVRAAVAAGADLVVIETMSNLLEAKAALLAVKEHSSLPAIVTMTFEEDGRTFLGTPPGVAALALSSLGASAVGANCSLGPAELAPIIAEMSRYSTCPISVRPNAGLPRIVDGETTYELTPEEFSTALEGLIDAGATLIGSCCGTDPRFTSEIRDKVDEIEKPPARQRFEGCAFSSAHRMASFDDFAEAGILVIGERINPTGNQRMKDALKSGDCDYAAAVAIQQEGAGADALDVNVGLPEIDEPAVMVDVIEKVQAVSTLPLVIDSSDPVALERAVRTYAGKPLINSVNGTAKSLAEVLPIIRHYGCAAIGLALDDDGLPETAEDRLRIAKDIARAAAEQGIARRDIIIDCLAMPVSAGQHRATDILDAIRLVKRELGVRTTLGVSNISFGLPARPLLNSVFLADAIGAGLDFPIIDPNSARYREVVAVNRALSGQDSSCAEYIAAYADWSESSGPAEDAGSIVVDDASNGALTLNRAIVKGQSADAAAIAKRMLEDMDATQILNDCLIPALDEVGELFEAKKMYLPQMLASAEAAKCALDVVREHALSSKDGAKENAEPPIVIATVKGDIHDIGKNIVKMLLENYGYPIIDLGRDVSPDQVLEAVNKHASPLVGLSALMTTTVPAMKETIALVREKAPGTKVVVGGAVLTPELAESLGADFYARDAVETARIAGEVYTA